jgi:hypothetical protein
MGVLGVRFRDRPRDDRVTATFRIRASYVADRTGANADCGVASTQNPS